MLFDTVTVAELLRGAPHNYLRSLGYNIEVKYLTNERDASIDQMARRLTDTDFLKKIVGKLSGAEKEGLKLIMSCPDGLQADMLYRRMGKLIKASSQKKRRELIDSLNKRGLVYEGQEENGGFLYFIPQDLYLKLSEVLVDELWNPLHGYDENDIVKVYKDGTALIRDIYVFLNYLKRSRVRITQKGYIFKKAVPKIVEQFELREALPAEGSGSDYPERFGFIYGYCRSEGLAYIEGDQVIPHKENIAGWLKLSTPQKTDRITYFAVGGSGPDWSTGVHLIRFCKPGVWFSTASLKEKVGALSVEVPRDGNYYYPGPERPQINDLFFRLLSYCGIIDLAWGSGRKVNAFKVTDLGATMLKVVGYEESFQEGHEEGLLSQSNFELMVPRRFPLALRYKVDQFADLKSSGQMNLYEITQISIYRALEEGLSKDDILDFLRDHSRAGVPQNVEYSISEWTNKYGKMYFLDAFLLVVEDENLAREIQASKKAGKHIKGKPFPNALLVNRSDYGSLLSALRSEGYMPRSVVESYSPSPEITPSQGPKGLVRSEGLWPHPGYNKPHKLLPPIPLKDSISFLEKVLGVDANSPQFLKTLEEVANLSYPDFVKRVRKSGALNYLAPGIKRRIPIGPNPWLEPSGMEISGEEGYENLPTDRLERLPQAKVREVLEYAIDNEMSVLIEHIDKRGRAVVIEVDPYDICKRGKSYYVEGFSYEDGREKTFKLEDIKALKLISDEDDDSFPF